MPITIATGLWHDKSKSQILGATLTLEIQHANILLSALTFLVTVAATSFWNITALILHHFKVSASWGDAVDLQHRVLLRNSGTATGSLATLLQMLIAWRGKGVRGLLSRTLALAVPAVLVVVGFTAASLLTSRIASKSHAGTLARLQPDKCGILDWEVDDTPETSAWLSSKTLNDTIAARSYVQQYYLDSMQSPTSQSVFPLKTLPYKTVRGVACPFPNASRCSLGPNSAFEMSVVLDSVDMLGINTAEDDRVYVKLTSTCSPLAVADLTESNNNSPNELPHIMFKMGPLIGDSERLGVTYNGFIEPPESSQRYSLVSRTAHAGKNVTDDWSPIWDFRRTDADVSAFFMTRHSVGYLAPVTDPWFTALEPLDDPDWTPPQLYVAKKRNPITVLGCTTQYSMCLKDATTCSPPGGVSQTAEMVDNFWGKYSSMTMTQKVSATRVMNALFTAQPVLAVAGLGDEMLFAKSKAWRFISPGLPPNQWEVEVLGWFQTTLARVQAAMIEFASKAEMVATGPGATPVRDPYSEAWVPKSEKEREAKEAMRVLCENQLVRTTGQVQNFSFLGIMIVVCGSLGIVMLDWSLEAMMNWWSRGKVESRVKVARRDDSKLHLLKEKLCRQGAGDDEYHDGGDELWVEGFMGIPVTVGVDDDDEDTMTQLSPHRI